MIRRVGDTTERKINIRLISASNQDLLKMVEEGNFRNDLYYRLEVIPINLPSLNERKEDIVRLASAFLENIKRTGEIRARYFSREAIGILEKYSWPGNIRELKNLVERVAILCDSETIEPKHLPKKIRTEYNVSSEEKIPGSWQEFREYKHKVKDRILMQVEKEFLVAALRNAGGNISLAADNIGMQRTNLHALLKKYKINAKIYS